VKSIFSGAARERGHPISRFSVIPDVTILGSAAATGEILP